jgi:hypothetical protein
MKTKWQALSIGQRVLLLLQAFLMVLFLTLYASVGRQQVISYQDALFRRQVQGNTTVYTGKLNGERAVWTVSPGPVVEFQWGDSLFGPYTITADSTALPAEQDLPEYFPSYPSLTGVEVRQGDRVLFRGGLSFSSSTGFWLISEDGEDVDSFGITIVSGDLSKTAPSVRNILRVALAPAPTQRGSWGFFLLGVLCCVACTASLWFADELFRWNLSFEIKDAQRAEPTEWALFCRWVSWVALTIVALVVFLIGLNQT